ncbi:hypothetical protein [Rhodococcus sp. JVH1]|uniref:hypothetical protein n=1 Tax=Rhodococcus sp. JVH1 TaxID=745408 RepID=UPI000271F489|nr:hypothetical protein [Rhodococcus sp. JVH1]EJI96038.1 hypothetical protein JVH1_6493 [Rhodococcus sp. JVH1]
MTTQQLSDLPAETVDVVTRWNPDGVARLTSGEAPQRGVFVAGPRHAGKTTLVGGLRALDASALAFVEDPIDARVILMVFDAAGPLGREELSVLDVVARPARPVVFALTKTDVHRNWAGVSERNRALLARHSTRFADAEIHPVAAGGSGAEALLAALLRAARAQGPDPRSATEAVLEQTRRMIVATARSVRETEPGAELRAERVRALTLRDGRRTERVAQLRAQVQLAKVELMHEVAAQCRAAGTTARAEIDRAGRGTLEGYPDRLAEMVRERSGAVDAAVTARLDDLRSRVGVTVSASGAAVPLPEPVAPDGPEPRHRGLEDRMTILIGASAGLGLGRLVVSPLSMVPALDIATIPLTLALGAVAAWWLTRARGHVAERAHMRQWATDALVHARSQWEQFVLGRLLAAEAEVSEAILAESRVCARDVDERVAQIDGELRRLAARRNGQLSSCERDLGAVDRGLQEVRRQPGEPNRRSERLNT